MNQPPEASALLDLSGKKALVTGASRGIGAGVARRFAEAGADVAVHYHTGRVDAAAVVEAIEATGGRSVALAADLRRGAAAEELVQRCLAELGGLDLLVNNAGIYPLEPLEEIDEERWDRLLEADLKSVHLCTRAAAKPMQTAGGGAIVNVASIEAQGAARGHSHYNAAKAGVVAYTRAAALELGPLGIRVNAVSPGLIGRAGLEEEWPRGVERWRREAPLGRTGEPADVADACLFLVSAAARWVTGANLVVDGGYLCRALF